MLEEPQNSILSKIRRLLAFLNLWKMQEFKHLKHNYNV